MHGATEGEARTGNPLRSMAGSIVGPPLVAEELGAPATNACEHRPEQGATTAIRAEPPGSGSRSTGSRSSPPHSFSTMTAANAPSSWARWSTP